MTTNGVDTPTLFATIDAVKAQPAGADRWRRRPHPGGVPAARAGRLPDQRPGQHRGRRGIPLTEVTSTVEGDIDLQGILGLDDEVPNGYQGIRVTFDIKGDATEEHLAKLVEQSRKRSAVFDVLTNGVPVTIEARAARG